MRTFAQKQNQPQKPLSSNLVPSNAAILELHHHADPILHLQRAIGNQALQQMLKTNAEEPEVGSTSTVSPRFGHDFSPIPLNPPLAGTIQTKLAINQAGDEYEQEANRVAEQVLAKPVHPGVSSARPRIQRYTGQANGQADTAPASVDHVLASPGRPLEPALQHDMEQRFGHDFSRVRVHSGAAAEQSAQDVNAHAYTVGHDVVFGADRFAPGTRQGRRLIAHELTHVVQQRGGGAPPGPAQERDAEAASRAMEMGARPQVRTRSQVGLAAQPNRGFAGGELLEPVDPENAGLKIVTVSKIEAKVARILEAPGFKVAEGREDFNASPAVAKARLYHSHFRDDAERLSYALGYFRQFLGIDGNGVNKNELFATLVNYEVQVQLQTADIVIHTPPTKAENRRLGELRAEHERREYESYLAEVARLNEEADKRLLSHTGVYSGAATVGLYESYVGEPVKATAKSILQMDTKQMVSLMVNFIPIVGQVKAVAEAIVGRDLITGEELPNWERGLNLLLAIIPEAHGIFSSGEAGLRTLARVAVDSAKPVDEVFRATKVASRLTVEEVQAVEKVVAGAPATPAQLKLAAKLEEMPGVTARSAAKAKAALAVKLEQLTPQSVQLAGKSHALSLRRVGNQLKVWLCSNGCGELIAKLEGMIGKLPANKARAELESLLENVRTKATWIDIYPTGAEAQQELQKLRKALEDIESRHPGVVNPDIPVAPAAPAKTPTAKPKDAPAADFDDLEPTGPLKPKKPRPRSDEDLASKASMAENFAKRELENSAWLRRRLPNDDHRRRFMKYLQEGHFGEHGHLTPDTKAADRVLEQWASGEPKVNLRP
jgi:hypothetical protein